ncbi:hypothetical protein [Halioglobus sp. HI00S01]|uniref:hypothetical protein n=1 Tax=Halioglobus sp. HI00S01 TaxID=1822214 RepID=UPI0012E75E71|nr:hypothetical protein [Halioglobus sp. HI00S01]
MDDDYPYVFLFLNHELLRDLDADDPMHEQYQLISATHVPTTRKQRGRAEVDALRMERRVKACKLLHMNGCYEEVARVYAPTVEHACLLATSFGTPWWQSIEKNAAKDVKIVHPAHRDIGDFDLVRTYETMLLKMPLGYIDLGEGKYIDGLP